MKRTFSVILILALVLGFYSTAVYASPLDSDMVKNWILSDSGKNISVKVLQYPKATAMIYYSNAKGTPVLQPVLHEIVLEMDLELSQKYFESFKNGRVIPEIVLSGLNLNQRASFNFTLKNCSVCGYTVSELRTGRLVNAAKAVVRFNAEKITSEKVNTSSGPIQIAYGDKLDTGKLTINGIEYSGASVFSGFDCSSMVTENTAGVRAYGGPLYNNSELHVQYDQIGTLPDWLASLDQKSGSTSGTDPQCKLIYEFSSPYINKKMVLEADMTAIGQELKDDNSLMFAQYTFKVTDLSFIVTTADAAPNPVMAVSPVTTLSPITTISPMIKGSIPIRASEGTWAGNWITTFGKMTLKQNGASVSGEYGNPIETLEGTAEGNKLSGTWKDSLSTGKFEFTMSADGNAFTGTMYNAVLGDRGTQEWNGDRQ